MNRRNDAHTDRPNAHADLPYNFVRAPAAVPPLVTDTIGYLSERHQPGIHRGLPSPTLTLIFSLDAPVTTLATDDLASAEVHSFDIMVGGLHTRPAYVLEPRHQRGIQLGVSPLAARRLFGMPASELVQVDVDGAHLLTAASAGAAPRLDPHTLLDRVRAEPDWAGRLDTVSAYLRGAAELSERRSDPRPEVVEAWRWLSARHGDATVRQLSQHVALSARQLTSTFRQEIGLSPKAVARLMRFSYAVDLISRRVSAGLSPALADVAAHSGYFDQSHMVREFVEFTDLSPQRWIGEELRNIQAGGHRSGEAGVHGYYNENNDIRVGTNRNDTGVGTGIGTGIGAGTGTGIDTGASDPDRVAGAYGR